MSAPAISVKLYQQRLDALGIVPRVDALQRVVSECVEGGRFPNRFDDSLAPIAVEKLRYSYTAVFEIEYPEYAAAMGRVLPVDTRVNPADDTWDYWTVDQAGFADWIADDGTIMPSGSMTAFRTIGHMAEMGHKYDVTLLELERATHAGVQLSTLKQANARRVHEAFTNWVWLFGDPAKKLLGLINHPNIQVTLAPTAGGAPFGDNRDRLIENKTIDEILADIEDLIERVPRSTIRAHYVAKVFMPYTDVSHLKRRRMGDGGPDRSVWEYIQANYGSPTAEHPAVQFEVLNECDPNFRAHPRLQTDTSGISGRFWLAVPAASLDELAFIRARPFTQRPPQEVDMKLTHITHSKVGGCKCQIPLAVHRKDFIASDNATASP